ncbi:hypothetical protein V7127_23705 [Bacillus sp. JJ1773]|uniref:hypothetical protein n=1 Tax=Bacillus sp. JJ1773 TaxID=3122965 RepID=UPI002FFE2CA5
MEMLYPIFSRNNFNLRKETTKAAEFTNDETKEIIYLVPTKKEISIILNPEIVDKKAILRADKKFHSTALTQFPKEMHTGAAPIHYGYSFKFANESELDSFLYSFNRI